MNYNILKVAIDAEYVGDIKNTSMLARVSIVDAQLKTILDTFVKPPKPVFYYRTDISGITKHNLDNAPQYDQVKRQMEELLRNNKLLIGFDMEKDLHICGIHKNKKFLRDLFKDPQSPYYNVGSLKKVASIHLNKYIQCGQHSSLEDATVAMELYNKHPY